MLAIIRENGAPAGARASAGRTLLEFFGQDPAAAGRRPIDTMSEAELDEAIVAAKLQQSLETEG